MKTQGLRPRALRLYLFALRDDGTEPLRTRCPAPHRISRSTVGAESARAVQGFDLQAQIDHGAADFSDGELVDLDLRARRTSSRCSVAP